MGPVFAVGLILAFLTLGFLFCVRLPETQKPRNMALGHVLVTTGLLIAAYVGQVAPYFAGLEGALASHAAAIGGLVVAWVGFALLPIYRVRNLLRVASATQDAAVSTAPPARPMLKLVQASKEEATAPTTATAGRVLRLVHSRRSESLGRISVRWTTAPRTRRPRSNGGASDANIATRIPSTTN